MGRFQWFRFFRREYREALRASVREEINCSVQFQKTGEIHKVWICDVSKTGIGFLIRTAEAEVGEGIIAHFGHEELRIGASAGRIVGQDVLYYGPGKKTEKSFFRFSAQFDSPISEELLERLQRL